MKITEFLKEKTIQIGLILFVIFTIEVFLSIYDFGITLQIYIPSAIAFAYIVGLFPEYHKKKKFYKNLKSNLEGLDKKYLIAEIIDKPEFVEGKILLQTLEQTDKSMIEEINEYKTRQEEYKEYIELWIHEIKMPIATSKMIIENNQDKNTKSIDEEIDKIDNFVEQALFYARSNDVEKDYMIKRVNLKELINNVVKKNKKDFIHNKIKIEIKEIEKEVNTDSKWMIFVLNQIIQNSVKYRREEIQPEIIIEAKENKENTILSIKDNGIGIKKGEEEKIFDKGFTGTNGRKTAKSTGIGLYLSKRLCEKLGHRIELTSIEGQETIIKIIFPNSSFNRF